jgi:hypothetical protein
MLSSENSQISRRNFLKSIAVLGLSSCVPFTSRTKFIHLLTNDPHPDQYTPILTSLIKIILPFDHHDFPAITPDVVLKNMEVHFPLSDENLEPFQRAFMVFNDIELFPQKLPAIMDEETKSFSEFEKLENAQIEHKMTEFLEHDKDLFQKFQKEFGTHKSFQSAPVEAQEAYFSLWAKSSFSIRRMFYNSAKGVINACAYCQDKMWDAIGYKGHFIHRENR